MAEFPLDLYPPADFTREDILRQIFGEVGNLCHDRKEYLFRSFWDRDECFRILQDFTDKYKANDSPGDPSPLHSPSRNRGNHNGNANRERERDNERDRESESGRDERSGSISSTNSLGSSSTRISHTQDRTGGVGGSSGGGNGGVGTGPSELKSILRRKTVTPTSATQTARANASTSALAEPSSPPLSTIRPTARARSVTPTLYSHLLPLTVPPPPPPGSPSLFNVFNSPQSGQGAVPGSVLTSREQTQNFLLGEVTPEEEEVDLRESQKEKERERERGEMKLFEPSEEIIRSECLFDVSRSAFTAVSLIDIRTTADDNLINFIAEEKKSRLKLIVVASETLPVTLDQFASMFIEVNAPFCMKKYHESVKDSAVQMTEWAGPPLSRSASPAISPPDNALLREIKFHKPVNLPGLKSTRGMKVQRYVRFGAVGLIVCSSTRLEDVPAADTFSVEDAMSVRAEADGKSVTVEITFEVRFAKSTMFRFAIEGATKSEMTKWLRDFFAATKAHCAANYPLSSGSPKHVSLSPTNALCVSPIRTAASGTSVALRKKNSRFLLGTSGESERDLGSAPPLHTQSSFSSKHGKRISPKSGGEPAHDAAKTLISAQIERRWTVAFVAYIICLSVLVGVCMERSERQWRSLNAKLDDILARSLDRQCPSFLDLKNIPVELKNIPVELKNILEPDDFESEAVSRTIVIP